MNARSAVVLTLAAIGERASLRMLRKTILDDAGALEEPSVVQQPAARLVLGIPNAALGAGYYALVAASRLPLSPAVRRPLRVATKLAAVASTTMSAVLAVSLLRKRLDCVNCWTAHAVNLALLVALVRERRDDGPA